MLTVYKPENHGFDTFISNDDFLCAFITSHSQYSFGRIKLIKRHNESDEVYILLKGNARVVTTVNLDGGFAFTDLEPQVAYVVEKGTWHYLAVSEDAIVFVAENSRVSAENTDTKNIFDLNITV